MIMLWQNIFNCPIILLLGSIFMHHLLKKTSKINVHSTSITAFTGQIGACDRVLCRQEVVCCPLHPAFKLSASSLFSAASSDASHSWSIPSIYVIAVIFALTAQPLFLMMWDLSAKVIASTSVGL